MPFITARTEYRSDTGLTAGCSTSGAWSLLQSEEDRDQRLPICWWLCPQRQNRGDDAAWNRLLMSRLWQLLHYHQRQKTLLNLCISLYLPLRGRTYRQLILTSPVWVVHLQQRSTLMLSSTTGWLRPASPSKDSVRIPEGFRCSGAHYSPLRLNGL